MSDARRIQSPPPRDMDETPFTPILRDLLRRVPGAYAAALVDSEGETVDYAGLASPFDIRVAAAHIQILLRYVDEYGVLGVARWIVVRGALQSLVARALPEGYALGLLMRKRAGFTASKRAFAVCERALAEEAGWKWPKQSGKAREETWHSISVEVDAKGRPRRIGRRSTSIEILGAVVGLPANERGFRVRVATGTELTLVRESRNCWYADAPTEEGAG